MALVWTQRDDDTIEQCKVAVANGRKYAGNAMPWFGLCLRMHKVLAEHGLLHRVVVQQVVCKGCVWECDGGCEQHFKGAHMDTESGEVRFCPRKTTQSMRESQLKQFHKKRAPVHNRALREATLQQKAEPSAGGKHGFTTKKNGHA